jgi:hypothetical protein
MELTNIITDLADALKAVDSTRPIEGNFKPGIGPHTEDHARDMALAYLRNQPNTASTYQNAGSVQYPRRREMCDLVIPEKWAIELKLLRPFGDNDREAEHWSSKIIHPYYGNKSAIGDMLKLHDSGFTCRKAIILFAYEHNEPRIDHEITLKIFEIIASECHRIKLGQRIVEERRDLVHSTFAVLKVIGWEIIGR